MKRILMLGLLALSLLCGTAFAKTGEGMTIWFDTGGSVGDGYGTFRTEPRPLPPIWGASCVCCIPTGTLKP